MGIAKPQFSEPCRLSSARNVLAITRLVSDCPFAHDLRQLVPCRPMATRPRRRANLRRPSSRGTRTPNSIGRGLADQTRGIRDAAEPVRSVQAEAQLHPVMECACPRPQTGCTPCGRGEAGRRAAGERGLQAEALGQGHRFGRSRKELPQPTREDQGAESGLQQGQAGSCSTDGGPYHAMLPGRKGRKTESAEELEAKQREETVDSPGSFTVISS